MNITKLGHCCLLIEHQDKRILTDPGNWTSEKTADVANIDIIIITHEHSDHYHIDSLKKLKENNPDAEIITNSAVADLMKDEGMEAQVIEGKMEDQVLDIDLKAIDCAHGFIHKDIELPQNTGYFIDETLFIPGDSLYNPEQWKIKVLAMPIGGPWMTIGESINYGLEVAADITFPVHDGMLAFPGPYKAVSEMLFQKHDLDFKYLQPGDSLTY
jgi:L-ascorbate metabolism protein UlaG (beta-lactamase superfamily)